MSGLGGLARPGKLVTEQSELPTTVDAILEKVRLILLKGEIKSISIREGQPIVYQRLASDVDVPSVDGASFAELTLLEVVRNVEMEEFDPQAQRVGTTPQILVFWMMVFVELRGWTCTHLLLAPNSRFWTWLGLPAKRANRLERFLGLRIERDKMVPTDVFMICGAKHSGAAISEIGFVLKGNVDNHERGDKKVDRDRRNSRSDTSAGSVVGGPSTECANAADPSAINGEVDQVG